MSEPMPEEIQSATQDSESVQVGNLPTKRAQDFIRVYGSIVAVSSSPWDVSFTVGHPIIEDPSDMHVEQRVAVTLSWQTTKALAQILTSNIRNYERQFGPIRVTPLPEQSNRPGNE